MTSTPFLIVLVVLFSLVASVFAYLFFTKNKQNETQGLFKQMQDSLESLQRNLLLGQKEFEKQYDFKTGLLRTEITQTLLENRKELQTGLFQSSHALESKVTGMDAKLDKKISELTHQMGGKLEQNLKDGFHQFEKIQTHLKQAEIQLLNLNSVGQSINDLNNLLKLPHLRGGFGEAILENILSDLLPLGSFELQYRISPDSTERVDAIIRYPNAVLPIDSKFPREQILPLFESNDPLQLEKARKDLVTVVKTLARQIKEKYIRPEYGTTEMALLFIPSETIYFEILRNISLCEELGKQKIFAVSPNTLAVTLHAISISRNYYEMAKGMENTIAEIKKAEQHFKNFESRFEEVGNALNKAQNVFQIATTHLSRYENAVNRLTENELPNKTDKISSLTPGLPS